MQKAEARFQTRFNVWIREKFNKTAAFELKHTHGRSSLPFASVKDHQIRALSIVRHGTLSYKIFDDSISYKPFDCFSLSDEIAYVVIKYPDFFCLIDVDTFTLENKKSK